MSKSSKSKTESVSQIKKELKDLLKDTSNNAQFKTRINALFDKLHSVIS